LVCSYFHTSYAPLLLKDIQQEIAIPFLFRDWDGPSFFQQYPRKEGAEEDMFGDADPRDGALWFRYIWSGYVADLETYDESQAQQSKVVFVPGIGCTINSMMEMANVESAHGSTYDTAGYNRSDPSAGAFCPYHSTKTTALEPIPKGSEIFASYGEEWVPDIPGAQITFDVVMDEAEDFLRDDYFPFVQQHEKKLPKKKDFLEALWNFTRDFPHPRPRTFSVLPRQVTWKEIQEQYDEFQKLEKPIMKAMAMKLQEDPTYKPAYPYYSKRTSLIRHFIRQNGQRSIEWIKENGGRCCDHMRPGVSQIPHAGRGAFATRDLPRGTIVGYSPLVHIGTYGKQVYNVPYDVQDETGGPVHYEKPDLIYNYAFYHPNSTVMLSPYGSMVNYINHAPSSPPLSDKNKTVTANVRLIWPDSELIAHKPEWLKKDVDFLTHTVAKIGLSWDYVALRNIVEGEEILLDYGPEWEAAWNQHVKNWVPPADADAYVHSSQWNEETLRTEQEQQFNPYPSNLHTLCSPAYMWNSQQGVYLYLVLDKEYIDRVPCRVLDRYPHPTNATGPEVYSVELIEEEKSIVTHNFERSHIFLTDRLLSQDWHLPNTFRHPIRIPDDMFPQSWINIFDDSNKH